MPKHTHCNKPLVYACTRVNIIQADDGTDDDDEADMVQELDDPETWLSKYYDELKQKKVTIEQHLFLSLDVWHRYYHKYTSCRAVSIYVTLCMA